MGMDLIPSQAMANAITTELTVGRNKVPSYTPFVIADLDKEPWCDPSSEHRAALSRWQENARHRRSSAPIPIPFQAWCLYHLRFLITGELCGAWLSFGGLAAQLSHFAIVLNIATTENMSIALSYDRLVRTDIQERARARGERRMRALPSDFIDLLKNENLKFKNMAIRENPQNRPPIREPKQGPPSLPKRVPKHRQPRSQPSNLIPDPPRDRSRSRSRPRSRSNRHAPAPKRRQRQFNTQPQPAAVPNAPPPRRRRR